MSYAKDVLILRTTTKGYFIGITVISTIRVRIESFKLFPNEKHKWKKHHRIVDFNLSYFIKNIKTSYIIFKKYYTPIYRNNNVPILGNTKYLEKLKFAVLRSKVYIIVMSKLYKLF